MPTSTDAELRISVNASVRLATPERPWPRPSSYTPMTSAENTIGTTIMKINRRNICPIGRRMCVLSVTSQGVPAYGWSSAPSAMPATRAMRSLLCSFTVSAR